MIHVTPQPEPADFDLKVRRKGIAWLHDNCINGTIIAPMKDYWRECLEDLYNCYGGVCAYLGLWLNRYQGITVDHFLPKSKYPYKAYEWNNYRLCSTLINARKKDYEDVLDPFIVEDGWFWLNFFTGELKPNPNISQAIQIQIIQTIHRLGLNDPKLCQTRCELFDDNTNNPELLKKKAPLVYAEAIRQGLI